MFESFRDPKKELKIFRSRALILGILVFLMFCALIWRMTYLQISLHEKYFDLSENNRLQLRPVAPNRGLIYDRNGVLLAENIPTYSLTLTPERVLDISQTLDFLEDLVGLTESTRAQIEERLTTRRRPFEAITLRQRLNEEEIAKVMVNRNFLPGVDIEAQLIRHYPHGKDFAHVLGYVGRINQKEQASFESDLDKKRRYSASRFIGKMGVEHQYEADLHGEVGYEKVETNARGRVIRVVERQDPIPGKDITLHLDSRLQALAHKEMEGLRGAIVAIEVATGGILSIYSNPSFDPNLFVTGISNKDYTALRENPDLPLFDRATRGQYPPASTLKPFVGLAVLDSKSTNWSEIIDDKGSFQLPNDERVYRDWKRSGHGKVNLERAIVESCDVYFYEMAVRAGIDNLTPFLAQFGFGRNMASDIRYALPGILPGREWKRDNRRSFWFAGDTVNLGIGQGYMLVTPLQLATATAVLANNGRWNVPRLIYAQDHEIVEIEHGDIPDIELENPQDWNAMHVAMEKVVTSIYGTAHSLNRRKKYSIAGKTGTAQVVSIAQDAKYDSEALQERWRDHALFIAYAPAQKPEIAIAIIVENGESAARSAGPISQKLIEAYLQGREN